MKSASFCFVEGEPAIFKRKEREYLILNLDFDLALEALIARLDADDSHSRPTMKEVWSHLSNWVADELNLDTPFYYVPRFNRKSAPNESSFETRMTRAISCYLDESFKRGLPDNWNEIKEWLKNYSSLANNTVYYINRKN